MNQKSKSLELASGNIQKRKNEPRQCENEPCMEMLQNQKNMESKRKRLCNLFIARNQKNLQ